MTLAGKVALVTGGTRGIGAAIVRQLCHSGADVAFTYVSSEDKAAEVRKRVEGQGRKALAIRADSADAEAVVAAVDQTAADFGRLDILVNNAGVYLGGPLEQIKLDELDRVLAVNVRAAFLASQAAARYLPRGGRIITIGSALTSRVPAADMTLYTMSKAALAGLTRGLARDLGPRGINATLIAGGLIDTDMNPADGPGAGFFAGLPAVGHYGVPDDIASMVTYLAGDAGRYVTGASISVDGGFAA